MRWNLNVPLKKIIEAGKWKPMSYKLYIREYSPEEFLGTQQNLESLQLPKVKKKGGSSGLGLALGI